MIRRDSHSAQGDQGDKINTQYNQIDVIEYLQKDNDYLLEAKDQLLTREFWDTLVKKLENGIWTTSRKDLHQKLSHLIKNKIGHPEAFYARHLNFLELKDFEMALYDLNQYADFAAKGQQKSFQYASLATCLLFMKFQNYSEAFRSLDEGIDLSRQNSDEESLEYCLWLLIHILLSIQYSPKDVLSSKRITLIDFLIERSKNFKSYNLKYLAYLIESQNKLIHGTSPTSVFYSIDQANSLSLATSDTFALGISKSFQSTVWNTYGYSRLGAFHSQLFLMYNNVSGASDDVSLSYCKLIDYHYRTGNLDHCIKIGHLARKKLFHNPDAQRKITRSLSRTNAQIYLDADRKLDARNAILQLKANSDDVFDYGFELVQLYIQENKKIQALEMIEQLMKVSTSARNISSYIHTHISKAKLFLSFNQPYLSIPTLETSSILSLKFNLVEQYIEAQLCLIHCLLLLKNYQQAKSKYHDIHRQLSVHASLKQQGIAHFFYSLILLAINPTDLINNNLSYLDQALQIFQKFNMKSYILSVLFTKLAICQQSNAGSDQEASLLMEIEKLYNR